MVPRYAWNAFAVVFILLGCLFLFAACSGITDAVSDVLPASLGELEASAEAMGLTAEEHLRDAIASLLTGQWAKFAISLVMFLLAAWGIAKGQVRKYDRQPFRGADGRERTEAEIMAALDRLDRMAPVGTPAVPGHGQQ